MTGSEVCLATTLAGAIVIAGTGLSLAGLVLAGGLRELWRHHRRPGGGS